MALSALDKCPAAQFGNSLLQLRLGVHYDRPVPGHRLLDRLARHQQETDALFASLHGDLVAYIKQDERAVTGRLPEEDLLAIDLFLRKHAERLGRRSKLAVALK